jgi:4-nitrophenyl phosphatase
MTALASPRRLASIEELEFSAVLSDLDGIVYRGEEAVPGATERFNRWHAQGLPYCFITNNAEKSSSDFADKIRRLGIPCSARQVVTSGDVALDFVRSRYAAGTRLYVIGSQSLKDRVAEAGFTLAEEAAQVVLVALDRQFNYAMMTAAVRNVLAGAELIGTNPDLIRPVADGFEPGAGAIVQSIAAATGVSATFLGKPAPAIVLTAMERLGVQPGAAIMLGDQLDTDILAAQRAAVRAVFVETGVPINMKSIVRADYVLRQL